MIKYQIFERRTIDRYSNDKFCLELPSFDIFTKCELKFDSIEEAAAFAKEKKWWNVVILAVL